MSGDLTYIGILPSSEAVRYPDRQFSHETSRVKYYHCWKIVNKSPDAFGDVLDIAKVKAVAKEFEQPIDESVFDIKFKTIQYEY